MEDGCHVGGPAQAPDSWKMADIDAGVSRILLTSRNHSSAAPAKPPEAGAPGPSGGVSEDVLEQVDQFLREALEKPRERLAILRMAHDVEKFIRDPAQQQLEFQGLPTSYLRLAAHRVAQHYSLQSIAIPDNSFPDGSGSRILLQKNNSNCPLPAVRLADIPVNILQEDSNNVVKLAIKQRPHKHQQNLSTIDSNTSMINFNKSVEERKEEYNRTRARIFSTSCCTACSSTTGIAKLDNVEVKSQDNGQRCSFVSARPDEMPEADVCQSNLMISFSDSSSSGIRSNRNTMERDPPVCRQRATNRVAIFRDHEVDRKDPDYDRSYGRYMQRSDPGFGYNGGLYTMQPLYSPAVYYNTEFAQLGAGPRVQIPIEHQRRPISHRLQRYWSTSSAPATLNYACPGGMLVSFNHSTVGAQSTSPVHMDSSQYSIAPAMSSVHPHEHTKSFAQTTHQQQTEGSIGLARPP